MRRRSLLTLGVFSSLAMLTLGGTLVACEDGPNQTYSPSAPGAGNYWNNGNPDASVGTATGQYDANFGQLTPLQLCTSDQQRIAWANMLTQPMVPGDSNDGLRPHFAGLNLAQSDWGGITYEEAEYTLCSGIDVGGGDDGTTSTEDACFGDNCEVMFDYVPATHVVGQIDLSLGYTGAADYFSDPAQFPTQHHYHMVIGQEIQKDGIPFEIDWNDPHYASLMEIYFSQMFTYGGGIGQVGSTPGCATQAQANAGKCPYPAGTGGWYGPGQGVSPLGYTYKAGYVCTSDQSCLLYGPNVAPALGGNCYFGIRPILSYWLFSCPNSLQPTVSTLDYFYFDYGKILPTSHLASDLRISAIGPSTHARPDTADPPMCNQYMGLEFNSFLTNCFPASSNVLSRSNSSITWEKLTGGHTHDAENVYFNVYGINMGWTDENVETPGSHLIVQDNYLPEKGDLVTDWDFDVRTESAADNDNPTVQNAPTQYQFRGSGLVQREFARLAQADMNSILSAAATAAGNTALAALYTHQIGDPACRVPPAQAQALGCTGLEGFAIGGMPEATDPSNGCTKPTVTTGACSAKTPCYGNICDNIVIAGEFAENFGYEGYYSSLLVPGDPTSYICQDPSQAPELQGGCVDGPVWNNLLQFVTNVVALGNPNLLPWQIADRRYFFRWWGIAMIKYYKAYGLYPNAWGTPNFLTAAEVANQNIDLASLFFDNNYGAGFDKDEYIDRSVMSPESITGISQGISVIVPSCNENSKGYPNCSTGDSATDVAQATAYPGPGAVAMDYNYGSDTIAANQRYTDWWRRMDREESAMFQAMLVNKGDLPGGENTVNITNLAGSPILAQNYLSYECATQWPNVTIKNNVTGEVLINNQPWESVCNNTETGGNCPAAPVLSGNPCPYPPGVGANGKGTPDLDQNGQLAGCGAAGCAGYIGNDPVWSSGNIVAQPRLAAYPGVWGGTGGWCPDSGQCTKHDSSGACIDGDIEGDSYATGNNCFSPSGECTNPYSSPGCPYTVVANTHGSVFQVGTTDKNNARIGFVPYTGFPAGSNMATQPGGQDLENQIAFVNIPNMANPFNSNTDTAVAGGTTPPKIGTPGSIQVTVPWAPNVDGVGFYIPTSGTTSKFVQTAQLDFTGVLETYLLDYVPWTDPTSGAADGTIKIEAIEGDDFLGEVFLCQDNGTAGGSSGDILGTQDLLGVHMYDSGGQVLQWLTQHPGAQDSCNIIVQYSQYDNYLDYISSYSGGVVVGISQGAGYGRITSVQIFDPSLAAIP
jgi:hypothetical protein